MKIKELVSEIDYDKDSEKEVIICIRDMNKEIIPVSISSINFDDEPVIIFTEEAHVVDVK